MNRFAAAFEAIDASTSTTRKVEAVAAYLRHAPPEDAAWGVYFLTGRKLSRVLSTRHLADWVCEAAEVPGWLFSECYSAVGDLAETVHLLLPDRVPDHTDGADDAPLHIWVDRLHQVRHEDVADQRRFIMQWLLQLRGASRLLLIKMLTGSLRVGVSQTLVERAAALVAGVEPSIIAHRLSGAWTPHAEFVRTLLSPLSPDAHHTALDAPGPYPFFLASPLDDAPDTLGDISTWHLEWKWDGIRGQLIRRKGAVSLWSRGDELLTERFPEIVNAARTLEDCVLDGEILTWKDGAPLGFAALQRRIGRTALSRAILSSAPAVFMAYDLLECQGEDLRGVPLSQRRQRLEALLRAPSADAKHLLISESLHPATWQEAATLRSTSRQRGVEGLMLKSRGSVYGSGRTKGDWWKWKIDPFSIDAVLIAAEPGHGRRAGLLTDYTFAVWDGAAHHRTLVPCARAYSGLDQAEIGELDRWLRAHTLERKGPVRIVEPVHVFELHFEGIAASTRHKSGIALRFPRIARWRTDKPASDADTLLTLRDLLQAQASTSARLRQKSPDSDTQPGLWDSPPT